MRDVWSPRIRARIVPEDIFERGLARHGCLQFRWRAYGLQLSVVHESDPIAQGVGLFHVVRGQ